MSNFPFEFTPPLSPWYSTGSVSTLSTPSWDTLFGNLNQPARPRIFVSYQHSSDQAYYDAFSKIFHDAYELVYDNSLERKIDSDNSDYVIQKIRDEFITNTSCTIVLVGLGSFQRKFIDWEIKATLDKEHGLIGIQLPHAVMPNWTRIFVPPRLHQNINSGYALWRGFNWYELAANPTKLKDLIAIACGRPKNLINNPREIMKRNG